MYKKNRTKIIIGAFTGLGAIILITLIYAAFTGQLNISGSTTARKSNWDIHFENLSSITTTGSAKALTQARIASPTSIEDYNATVTSPGDTISFTFKVVNEGNYNASISGISIGTPECSGTDSTSNSNVCSKLTYTLSYDNGSSVQVGDMLYAKETNIMKVTLTYAEFNDASLLPTEDVSISNLGITINYTQTGSALVKDNGEVANNRVYKQGDKITLNNEDYWVIENSGAGQDYVVVLKDLPLTATEVNTYGSSIPVTAGNNNGYSGGVYYGQSSDYDSSYIKVIMEQWVLDKFQVDDLKEINNYKVRLITKNEYDLELSAYDWSRYSNYQYWTMTPFYGYVYTVKNNGLEQYGGINSQRHAVRPVINIYKSVIESQ